MTIFQMKSHKQNQNSIKFPFHFYIYFQNELIKRFNPQNIFIFFFQKVFDLSNF